MIRKSTTWIKAFAIGIMILTMPTYAQVRDALFMGITDAAGQPAYAELEQAVRNALSGNPKFRLAGQLETERIIREKERLGGSRLENSVPASEELGDTVVIIRGTVNDFSMTLKRRLFFWSQIDAQISINFYFGDLTGEAAYSGTVSAKAKKNKDFVFFASPDKVVHISAIDRTELMNLMQSDIIKEVSELAKVFFNALASNTSDKKSGTPEPETETH
jgi:hypothetical protein